MFILIYLWIFPHAFLDGVIGSILSLNSRNLLFYAMQLPSFYDDGTTVDDFYLIRSLGEVRGRSEDIFVR